MDINKGIHMTTRKKAVKKKVADTISTFKPKIYKMPVLNPTTFVPTSGWVDLVGMYSVEFDTASRMMRNRVNDETNADIEEETIIAMAACMKDWNSDFFEAEFSQDAAIAMLKNPELAWVRIQIDNAVRVTTNFF